METIVTGYARPAVRVFPDQGIMSRAAADIVLVSAVRAIASRGRFTLALSGGSTPRQLYALLASSPYRKSIPWPDTHIFWADERCVPREHPESNYKLAFDTFLENVPLPAGNIHPVAGEQEPGRAAAAYEQDLRKYFSDSSMPVFDLVLLGVGNDGHTASLFPGSIALTEKKRFAVPVYLEPPKSSRVTLTLPVLNNAEEILFLATGRAKASIIQEIIEQGNPKGYPAGLVNPVHGRTTWVADHEAAGLLTGSVEGG